jgi:1,4-alpha-glucan branching enzyme
MSIYEVHLGSWRQGLTYTQLADELVDYVKASGFTHVEFLPVAEHPYGGSWGYHVTSYYAPTARFGNPDELRHLIDKLHQANIGVIVDWVPGHFATDPWALVRFDGTALYEHPDPRRGWHPEWGSYIFNQGRAEVSNFLVANALYWLEEFHIDGLRVDGVASMLYLDYSRKDGEWVPNQYGGRENLEAVSFLQEVNATAYKRVPGTVIIAEESTAWPGVTRPTYLGGLGFGFKWNMGWMNDTLAYIGRHPIHRQYHHNEMTFAMMYAFSENYVLPLSHDEVVHGKGSIVGKVPGDRWQQMATVRALYAFMWAHPGKQLLFMGSEFAQYREWSESRSLDWPSLDASDHRGVYDALCDLNRVYGETRALWSQDTSPAGFSWIDANDRHGNVLSFLRFGDDDSVIACVVNFSPLPHDHYRIGLPEAGRWDEVINTDAESYGGSGVGNLGAVEAEEQSWHGLPASTTLRVPPLGAIWLRYAGEEE